MLTRENRIHVLVILLITSIMLIPSAGVVAIGVSENHESQMVEEENQVAIVGSNLGMDNFWRKLFGINSTPDSERRSRSRRHNTQPASSGSNAERKSRSVRHSSSRPERYSPPASNSNNPQQLGGGSSTAATRSSNMSAVRNTPKPPLNRSLRDQSKGLGFWELGFSIGTTHSLTDIGASKSLPFNDFTSYHTSHYSLGGGVYGRYLMNDWFAMNLAMNFSNLHAEVDNPNDNIQGAIRFNNDIFEFYTNSEFRMPALASTPFDLYGFVGIGIFFSDASIYDSNDRLISNQVDYNQVQPFIPFGGGFSIKVTNSLKLGYEFGWRNTIFHYLDGVKSDDQYDQYFLNSFKIGFTF
jgi:hypothetical protein